jgi:hypothetical protein
MASPKFGPWWILWIQIWPWFVLAPKVLHFYTHQLVVWFCASLCEWLKCLSILLVPSRSSSTPLYPQSAMSQGACTNSSLFRCFHFRLTFESIKEVGSTSILKIIIWLHSLDEIKSRCNSINRHLEQINLLPNLLTRKIIVLDIIITKQCFQFLVCNQRSLGYRNDVLMKQLACVC